MFLAHFFPLSERSGMCFIFPSFFFLLFFMFFLNEKHITIILLIVKLQKGNKCHEVLHNAIPL